MTNFAIGDRVKVLEAKYHEVHVGAKGTVKKTYGGNISVDIDHKYNHNSQYGYYYYNATQLELLNEGSNNMNTTNQSAMTGNFRVAEMQFIEGRNTDAKYLYACYDASIEVDDICVVKTLNHGFGIAKVVGFVESDKKVYREIICAADFSCYNKRVADRKRMSELLDLMQSRAADIQQLGLFKLLAKEDAGMQSLLNEFEQLTNN